MKNFIPESPRIKYIIPKVKPSSFSLNEGELEETNIYDKNEFNLYTGNLEYEDEESKQDYIDEKGFEEFNHNSILKTLLKIYKKKESISSIETKDSF